MTTVFPPSFPQSPLPYPHYLDLLPFTSPQKRATLPGISIKHGVSNFNKARCNPVGGKGFQKQAKESEMVGDLSVTSVTPLTARVDSTDLTG